MKDYSLRNEKSRLIKATATSLHEHITELFENGYDQGYEDGQNAMIHDHEVAEKKAYEDGMNVAWEVARKLVHPRLGGYTEEQKQRIFGEYVSSDSILRNFTASEAIAKIKEYEDKQKSGKWIRIDKDKCKCDQCEVISFIAMYPNGDANYCPNCGARMESEDKA